MKAEILLLVMLIFLSALCISIGINIFLVIKKIDFIMIMIGITCVSIGLISIVFSVNEIKKEL